MAKKILKVASLGLIGGSLLGGKKKKAAPVEDGPKVMPLADDEAVKRAKKQSLLQQMGRGGRSSTILSDDSDSLGA